MYLNRSLSTSVSRLNDPPVVTDSALILLLLLLLNGDGFIVAARLGVVVNGWVRWWWCTWGWWCWPRSSWLDPLRTWWWDGWVRLRGGGPCGVDRVAVVDATGAYWYWYWYGLCAAAWWRWWCPWRFSIFFLRLVMMITEHYDDKLLICLTT